MVTDTIETKQENKPGKLKCASGKLLIIFLLLLAIIATGLSYFQLSTVTRALTRSVKSLQKEMDVNQKTIVSLHQTLSTLEESAKQSQDLSAQQEKMISEWQAAQSGNLNKWYVAEAEYLTKLANDHIQFTHDIPLAIALLSRADQVLANLQDTALLAIRKSLANDLAKLQALPTTDITSLYLQLVKVNQQLDQLPLPSTPLKTTAQTTTVDANAAWWKRGLERSLQALSQIVIVRRNDGNTLPLILPDERIFLYQNLHAQMEGSMWSVLQRDDAIYQANLTRAVAWIQAYFVQEADLTQNVLKELNELRNVHLKPTAIDLADTLALFVEYDKRKEQPTISQ